MKEGTLTRSMAGVSPVLYYPAEQPLPTPSPLTFSVASSGWSSRPSHRLFNLFMRSLVLLFSFISALSLAAPSPQKKGEESTSFNHYSELRYCFIIAILVSLYSAYQLFKSVCDIAYRGLLISDKISDYTSFILDQMVCYLLISSSSVSVIAMERIVHTSTSLWKANIVSLTMSFAAFFVIAVSALLSGYKLCKRISW